MDLSRLVTKAGAIEWSFGKRDWSTGMLLLQGGR
jgi:hypothetical protein